MPIDTRRIAEQNEFARDLAESELAPNQSQKTDKSKKTDKTERAGRDGGNLTVEHADRRSDSATQPQQVQLAPPTVSPAAMMILVQSLQSKTAANEETSSGNQLSISRIKMSDSIKKYEDNIKKEEEEKKKAHHKKTISEWISGAIDAVEFAAGAALAITGVGTVAGVALMATATVNAVDLALTASGAVHGEGAKILGGVTIAADVCIAVVTLGAGVATGVMNAALETGEDVTSTTLEVAEEGTEQGVNQATKTVVKEAVEEVAEEVAKESLKESAKEGAEEMTEQGVDHAGDAGDSGDSSDVNDDSDVSDDSSGDGSSGDVDAPDDDGDGLQQLEKMFDQEIEEEFSQNFAEDTVEDAGDSGDDSNVPKRTKGQIIKAAVKASFGLYAKGAGIAGAGTGAVGTWNKVEQHHLAKKADDYETQATDAEKDEATATMNIQEAIKHLQTQLDEYTKISESVSNVLNTYEQSATDTSIRGFA